ncbi:ComF family protein [Flammeovirga pectinis]|uniref:ComF family protein n=1 Tax=Flammeovirga pectinis TaxID=2494373 RepID=A0A3S9P7X8_9BACT|nr:ComF family protein [Flammeovirga pectinis]AZQ64192.1 ComF family protein [Flammeovirga pectinis]
MQKLIKLLKTIFFSLFPDLCFHCNQMLNEGEEVLCFHCHSKLPVFDGCWVNAQNNIITQLFNHKVNLKYGLAFFYYENFGVTRSLIHHLKYKNQEVVGTWIVNHFGDLYNSAINDIDYIVPIPLHSKRKKERGYNQVDTFCTALSDKWNIPYIKENLIRKKYTNTQTKKTRMERVSNLKNVFDVKKQEVFSNKHILLVDDVLTTGSTLESAGYVLLDSGIKNLSILTIGIVV